MENWKRCSFILLVLFGTSASAQQAYNASHYGTPGDLYLYNRFVPGVTDPGLVNSGADMTWDLGANAALNTHVNQIVPPGQAISQFNFLTICALSGISTVECFNIWTNTNQALLLADTLEMLQFSLQNIQRYHKKTSNFLLENFFGFTVDLNGIPTAAVIVYENPDTVISFPVTYGKEWTSSTAFTLDLSPIGQDLVFSSHQTRTSTADSWGILITPYDTFENVVRIRSDVHHLDTLWLDSLVLPLDITQVEYMWFDTNYTLPVLTANGILGPNDTVIINTFEYIYEATCPAPTWMVNAGADVFYLDSSGSVTIDFEVENSNANIYSWDFSDGTFEDTEGNVSHVYTGPGSYSVAVVGCMTHCLPLNSCSFQILNFEIQDTVTSVHPVSGEAAGIKLYPNPVSDVLRVNISEGSGFSEFIISDASGKRMMKGLVSPASNEINIASLPGGIYMMQFNAPGTSRSSSAMIRFCKQGG